MKRRWWIIGYFTALAIALLSPLASGDPDGLQRVAADEGFLDRAERAPYRIIADYMFPGVGNEALATVLAGIVGTTIVYLLVAGTALVAYRYSARRRRRGHAS